MEDITGLGKVAEQLPELTKEFRELIVKVLEPSATEIGAILGDYFKRIRERNLIRGLKKTQKLLVDQSNVNQQIPPRTQAFLPILEQISLMEDDNLQDKWAKLLASELSGNFVHNMYIRTLKDLTPLDAKILDFIFDHCNHLFISFKDDERNTYYQLDEDIEFYTIGDKIEDADLLELESTSKLPFEFLIYQKYGGFWTNPEENLIKERLKGKQREFVRRKIAKICDGTEHIRLKYRKNQILESLEMFKKIDLCRYGDSVFLTYKSSNDCKTLAGVSGTDIQLTEFGKKFMQTVK